MSALRRVTGMGIAGSLALALLAGGCVLAATAGPREAQATGLLGVQQMMNGLPQVEKTIVVATNYVVGQQRSPGRFPAGESYTGQP